MKKIYLTLLVISLFITGCGKEEIKIEVMKEGTMENIKFKQTEEVTENVKITMENGDMIILELYKDIAPISVENFQKLVKEDFYNGLIFHRVIKDFMIQTGDPLGNGTGGSDETIKGEFSLNGVENNLSHERGVISMARKGAVPDTEETMNSASSQFFIVHEDSTFLDGNYAAFGKVIAGMDTVDKIASVSTGTNDLPSEEQKMISVDFVEIEKIEE